MDWRRYIPDHAATTVPVLALIVAFHFLLLNDTPRESGIEPTDTAPMYYEHWRRPVDNDAFDIDARLAQLELDDAERDRRIREFLQHGDFARARTLLLEVTAAAVLDDDQPRIADSLLLLGEVAINQQELAAAEIYLQEALYLTIEQDSPLATGRAYQLLGQLNIRARELARRASYTYDQLWQARNAIARGMLRGVDDNLRGVIAENLAIRRYGAAADAWEALASMHERVSDGYQAQLARLEAARLYATTGQAGQVQRLLDGLDRSLISDGELLRVEGEIDALFEQHRQDQIKASQARDYQMLYHHYLRIGQLERAWEFRIKSSERLADSSDRALFQRQADVIAVLYNSNFAMDRARRYLDRAGAIYQDQDSAQGLEQTRDLESLIF